MLQININNSHDENCDYNGGTSPNVCDIFRDI
jgi:hypothetical protein